jgi:hypothetical protein
MIDESTWHKNPDKQKHFTWVATTEGVQLHHSSESSSYLIPWAIFYAVFQHARNAALNNNGVITAGIHQSKPTPGSVGDWVLKQSFNISNGVLTPRHLSFIGPILGRMGFIRRQISGNSIQWVFN